MITILSLWLPILLSAIGVFIVSSIIHMVLTYHRSDVTKLPDEKAFREKISALDIPPGEYIIPHANSPKDMGSEEYLKNIETGPVGFFTILPNSPWPMGKSLLQWFIYSILVGFFAAYIASQSLQPGANYMQVMQLVGASAFGGYGLALIQNSIWKFTPWSTTAKFFFDALVYALITGGFFGWLWPQV